MLTVENAKIERTHLGLEDNGRMSGFISLAYYGRGQGFGHYLLDSYEVLGSFVTAVLEAVGVDTWEQLTSKHVRSYHDRLKISALGNFLDDRWVYYDKFWKVGTFKEVEGENS